MMKKPGCFFRQPGVLGSLLLVIMVASALNAPAAFAQDAAVDVFAALQTVMLENPTAVPAFSLPAVDGSMHSLEDYKGKLVFLNFWTTW